MNKKFSALVLTALLASSSCTQTEFLNNWNIDYTAKDGCYILVILVLVWNIWNLHSRINTRKWDSEALVGYSSEDFHRLNAIKEQQDYLLGFQACLYRLIAFTYSSCFNELNTIKGNIDMNENDISLDDIRIKELKNEFIEDSFGNFMYPCF
jgi:hypothetical protein